MGIILAKSFKDSCRGDKNGSRWRKTITESPEKLIEGDVILKPDRQGDIDKMNV